MSRISYLASVFVCVCVCVCVRVISYLSSVRLRQLNSATGLVDS
jgi:hypothetical protein